MEIKRTRNWRAMILNPSYITGFEMFPLMSSKTVRQLFWAWIPEKLDEEVHVQLWTSSFSSFPMLGVSDVLLVHWEGFAADAPLVAEWSHLHNGRCFPFHSPCTGHRKVTRRDASGCCVVQHFQHFGKCIQSLWTRRCNFCLHFGFRNVQGG